MAADGGTRYNVRLNAAFSGIKASRGVKIEYTVIPDGGKVSATLIVSGDTKDNIDLRVKDGTLVFGWKDGGNDGNVSGGLFRKNAKRGRKAVLRLSAPAVGRISVSSAADVATDGGLDVASLDLSASSAGNIRVAAVKAEKVSVKTSSSGNVEIGSALASGAVGVSSSSGGTVELESVRTARINASASSGGSIDVSGTADMAELKASSGGNVDCDDLVAGRSLVRASSGGSAEVTTVGKADVKSSSGGRAVSHKAE